MNESLQREYKNYVKCLKKVIKDAKIKYEKDFIETRRAVPPCTPGFACRANPPCLCKNFVRHDRNTQENHC